MFVSRADDIYVASYPRSGTTWVQMLLVELFFGGEPRFDHLSDVSPFLDIALRNQIDLDRLGSPRILKTHLSFRQIGGRPGRYLYVMRDGRDVLVSYFHFWRAYGGYEGQFAAFFEDFVSGRVQYGSWFKHVASWTEHKHDSNLLLVHYEDLLSRFDETVETIAVHCGVVLTPRALADMSRFCGLGFMKRHEGRFAPAPRLGGSIVPTGFIRNGKSGGWKDYLSPEQDARFQELAGQLLGHRGVARVGFEVGPVI